MLSFKLITNLVRLTTAPSACRLPPQSHLSNLLAKRELSTSGPLSKEVEAETESTSPFVNKTTPYQRPRRVCILCKHKIQLDYKNPRLLAQFVSPLNGNIYDKHITGLCEKQQTILQREIKKSRLVALMPIYYKQPRMNKDPPLFNPERPQRPNPY